MVGGIISYLPTYKQTSQERGLFCFYKRQVQGRGKKTVVDVYLYDEESRCSFKRSARGEKKVLNTVYGKVAVLSRCMCAGKERRWWMAHEHDINLYDEEEENRCSFKRSAREEKRY